LPQRRVEDGGVLPLDKAHGTNLAGDGDMHILPHYLPAEGCRRYLMVVAHSGEGTGNGDGPDALGLHFQEKGPGSLPVKGGQFLAVVLEAAAYDGAAGTNLTDIIG